MRFALLAVAALLIAPPAPGQEAEATDEDVPEAVLSNAPTRVLSERDADRLRNLEGITLQWIDWDTRGSVRTVRLPHATIGERWYLVGNQTGSAGEMVEVLGWIEEIGPDYFILRGTIAILDTPDKGRVCEAQDVWRFEVTQNRSYYRLRRFEWCDYLTDYVDLYFRR